MFDADEEMKRDLFYVWFIPLLWCGFTIVSYFHPGDEYGLFACGSMAGAWLFFFCRFDSLGQGLLPVLAAGAIVIIPFGFVLDLLRVKKRYWFILFALLVAVLFYWQFTTYGSFERMRRKQGYVIAVVVALCNLSIYATTLLAIAGGLVGFLIRKVRGNKPL
jgi:hypothetical protein